MYANTRNIRTYTWHKMIDTALFFNILKDNDIHFFSGVPDSLLKYFCAYLTDNVLKKNNIIAANEGGAIALGAGYHLATGNIPLIYMQNSGLGNAINPLLSLTDKKVYSIPLILLIGWRGEPGISDEPQHLKQGEITLKLLEIMGIPYKIAPNIFDETKIIIDNSIAYSKENSSPTALIIRENFFAKYDLQKKIETAYEMKREDAIKIIVHALNENDIIVSTTGKTSRELFEYREKLKQGHGNDFLTVGSMGHASQLALGIAVAKPNRQVFCIDGDGSVIMHTGSLGIIGASNAKNLKHIVINNGAHDSVGGQPTIGFDLNFADLAIRFNYKNAYVAEDSTILNEILKDFNHNDGPLLLEVKVNKGARKDLGRPTISPIENKRSFMKNFLKKNIQSNEDS